MKLKRFCETLAASTLAVLLASTLTAQQRPHLLVDPYGFPGAVRDIAISPDNEHIAVAAEKEVRIWNFRTGNLKATLRGELRPSSKMGRANAVTFSHDGRFLIVGVSSQDARGNAGSIRSYAMSDLSKVHQLITGQTACTDRLAVSPDGKWIASYG